MRALIKFLSIALILVACSDHSSTTKGGSITVADYMNFGDTGVRSAGIRMIPVQTPAGVYNVWTKRFGNNPRIKILLLHGGPAIGHEYMECFESFFPQEGFEFYEYDQLGASYSDQPKDTSLWRLDRFVEEVEQVRKAIGADSTNFYILGNSWGGILGMQYALKYQQNMKALIVANMMASCPEYGRYADEVLARQMDPAVYREIKDLEAKGKYDSPRYMELLVPNFYNQHFCRLSPWPEPVSRSIRHVNEQIYVQMQGPSEFGIGGNLANWDIKSRLHEIRVPTLMIGAKWDTMDPKAMEEQSRLVQHGTYLYCPNGSHLSMWDDQQVFMKGVISFIHGVDGR